MKERVIYNSYYEGFEEFKKAIFSFFEILSSLDPNSILGQTFKNRVRDKFSPIILKQLEESGIFEAGASDLN